MMNIPWNIKALLFRSIDFFNKPNILYFLQKYVTKRSKVGTLVVVDNWESHKKFLKLITSQ